MLTSCLQDTLMKELLRLLRDAALFVAWMAMGLARRAARGIARAAERSFQRMRLSSRPAATKDSPAARAATSEKRRRNWTATFAIWGIATIVVYGLAAIVGVHVGRSLLANADFKPPEVPHMPESSHVLAADGSQIYTFSAENRDYVPYASISPYVVQGLVAVEDAQYFHHIGLNFRGMARAGLRDIEASIRAGRLVFPQGGSSITQQLAKQLFLSYERTPHRKITEALYALHLEQEYSKNEILEFYLNKVNLGAGYHGVEAASLYYFGKHCKDLSLAEGALIAGIGQRPSALSPTKNPDAARNRRNHVLDCMVEAGYITKEVAEAAKAEPVVVATKETERRLDTKQAAPFFVEDVRRQLLDMPETTGNINTGGLEIETTIHMDVQRMATRSLREGLRKIDKTILGFRPITTNLLAQGGDVDTWEDPLWQLAADEDDVRNGVVMESASDGAIVRIGDDRVKVGPSEIAWTKHRDVSEVLHRGDVTPFRVVHRNEKTGAIDGLSLEQDPILEGALVAIEVTTGEVIAMAGGFDYDRSQFNKATQAFRQAGSSFKPIYFSVALERGLRPSTLATDEPTVFIDAWTGDQYKPENYHKDYKGRVTLREALEDSLNIPSVRLLNYIGYKDVIATARKFGFSNKLNAYPSMALGAQEMTLLELTSAYSTFPNGGIHVRPTLLRRVRDSKGRVLFEHQTEANEVVSPQTAFQMVQLMRGVVNSGTATQAKTLGRPLAGKTGTTDDYTDAWFIGYTPSIVVGVWTGYEDEVKTIGKDYTGAKAALPIWIDFMRSYLATVPEEQFVDPGGVEVVAIDKNTGLVASDACPPSDVFLETFKEDNRPVEECSAAKHRGFGLPHCLQDFAMDDEGTLVVPDEQRLFALESDASACPIQVDPIERVVLYAYSPVSPPAQYSYRVGVVPQAAVAEDDSIESFMRADRRTTRDGAYSDFDMLDGRTVIIVRNDR